MKRLLQPAISFESPKCERKGDERTRRRGVANRGIERLGGFQALGRAVCLEALQHGHGLLELQAPAKTAGVRTVSRRGADCQGATGRGSFKGRRTRSSR